MRSLDLSASHFRITQLQTECVQHAIWRYAGCHRSGRRLMMVHRLVRHAVAAPLTTANAKTKIYSMVIKLGSNREVSSINYSKCAHTCLCSSFYWSFFIIYVCVRNVQMGQLLYLAPRRKLGNRVVLWPLNFRLIAVLVPFERQVFHWKILFQNDCGRI